MQLQLHFQNLGSQDESSSKCDDNNMIINIRKSAKIREITFHKKNSAKIS